MFGWNHGAITAQMKLGTRGWYTGLNKVAADTGKINGWMQRNSQAVKGFGLALGAAGGGHRWFERDVHEVRDGRPGVGKPL